MFGLDVPDGGLPRIREHLLWMLDMCCKWVFGLNVPDGCLPWVGQHLFRSFHIRPRASL